MGGDAVAAGGRSAAAFAEVQSIALVFHGIVSAYHDNIGVVAHHFTVAIGNVLGVETVETHLIVQYQVVRGIGVGIHIGIEVLVNQAVGIPFGQGGEILLVAFLHGAVFYLAVNLVEGGAHLDRRCLYAIAGGEEIALIGAVSGKHHGGAGIFLVFECSQNIVIFIIGSGTLHTKVVQPVLTDLQAIVREAATLFQNGNLIDVALIGGQIR